MQTVLIKVPKGDLVVREVMHRHLVDHLGSQEVLILAYTPRRPPEGMVVQEWEEYVEIEYMNTTTLNTL